MCTVFCWGNLRERCHWGDPDVDGRIVIRWMRGRNVQRVLVGNLEGKISMVVSDVDGRIKLR
jgi:hypothetical protein